MTRATPQVLNFVARLVIHETSGRTPSESKMLPAFLICEKLRPKLGTLMGTGGVRALLTRALALARADLPSLRAVRVNADGTLQVSTESGVHVDPKKLAEGSVVMLAQLFGLLVALIGANLTSGLVHEIWPDVQLDTLELSNGEKNVETE